MPEVVNGGRLPTGETLSAWIARRDAVMAAETVAMTRQSRVYRRLRHFHVYGPWAWALAWWALGR